MPSRKKQIQQYSFEEETPEQQLRRLILEQQADRASDSLRMSEAKTQRLTRKGWRTKAK